MTYLYRDDRDDAPGAMEQLLEELDAGDCMVVQRFSGAAKTAKDLLALLNSLEDRGIRFRSVEEKFDTGTEEGRYALGILTRALQLDADARREKQREGIENAKEEGKYKGRKPIEVDEETFDSILERWRSGEITARQAMNELNLKPNTFYRRAKERMTNVKNRDAIWDAAKQLGKEIVAGVQAETAEFSQAAEHDIDALTDNVREQLEKNITAAGKVINRRVENLSRDFQEAVDQYEQKQAEKNAEAAKTPEAAETAQEPDGTEVRE